MVCEKNNSKILWDMSINTRTKFKTNRPDMIIHDKRNLFVVSLTTASLGIRDLGEKYKEVVATFKRIERPLESEEC